MQFRKIETTLQQIERAEVIVSWSASLFVTMMLVLDVSLRFFLNLPLPASWEMSEVIMPYIVMFGFAYTLTKNVHIEVTIVADRLPSKAKVLCEFFRNMVSLGMCVLITYWSWVRFWESFVMNEEILAAIRIPWWLGKLGMPVAFFSLGVRFMINIIQAYLIGTKPHKSG